MKAPRFVRIGDAVVDVNRVIALVPNKDQAGWFFLFVDGLPAGIPVDAANAVAVRNTLLTPPASLPPAS